MSTPKDLVSLREHIGSRVIGQQRLVDSMITCLLSDGHLLVQGLPGLAKTTAVNALSEAIVESVKKTGSQSARTEGIRRRLMTFAALDVAALLFVVWAMVYKPGI